MRSFPRSSRPSSSALRTLGVLAALVLLLVASAPAAEHTININGLTFDPDSLNIAVGDTVTWINDGGLHNVDSDDGSFTSGPPSTDLWQFSHTFGKGGTYTYHCDTHVDLGMTGTIIVEGVFADGLESGSTQGWDDTQPLLPNCNCYFSSDCAPPNDFCDWGNLTEEDICLWRLTKPDGVPEAGCDAVYNGDWIAGICDGTCAPPNRGSSLGWEERSILQQGITLWADAILLPAEAGGDPIDARIVEQIAALGFRNVNSPVNLGRQVADLFINAGIPELYDHFCHFEAYPGDHDPAIAVDLSNDPCRLALARNAVSALVAEIGTAGSAPEIFTDLPAACADRANLFEPRCSDGPGAMRCVAKRIEDTATFLTTPGAGAPPVRFVVDAGN